MVHLTKIYTKTGDEGMTSLGNNSRVSKTDPLIEAYSTVDEVNAHIGMLMAFGELGPETMKVMQRIQNELFDLGADLCKPMISISNTTDIRVTADMVKNIESDIDNYNATLEPLRSFVMPGGTKASALFHVARTITRRAERRAWAARELRYINPHALKYLNRLSDLMFVMARFYNEHEVLWQPGGEEQHPPKRFRDISNGE